jgi:hypothetical protein
MTLNYKQIPYTESFLTYPDIAKFTAKFNIPDDESFGRPTLPAILHYDAQGKLVKAMSNSIWTNSSPSDRCSRRHLVSKKLDGGMRPKRILSRLGLHSMALGQQDTES